MIAQCSGKMWAEHEKSIEHAQYGELARQCRPAQ